mmetsp:Transcript_107367/g.303654  ORF Transcript_107367/g.303654 Transcript_107367/m.303654 type:complete len:208 (-) Transcript_107367:284-907(-)
MAQGHDPRGEDLRTPAPSQRCRVQALVARALEELALLSVCAFPLHPDAVLQRRLPRRAHLARRPALEAEDAAGRGHDLAPAHGHSPGPSASPSTGYPPPRPEAHEHPAAAHGREPGGGQRPGPRPLWLWRQGRHCPRAAERLRHCSPVRGAAGEVWRLAWLHGHRGVHGAGAPEAPGRGAGVHGEERHVVPGHRALRHVLLRAAVLA